MKIKVLGTGTCVPSLQRSSSSYLVQTKQLNILIDVGPSVVRRLLEYGFTTRDIDVIILTHFHVDHTADLSTFLFASNYDVEARAKELSVLGGDGLHDFYRGLLAVYPWLLPRSYEISLCEMSKGTLNKGGLVVTTAQMEHNNESIGVRFEERKSVTFSGDTDYTKNLIKLHLAPTSLLPNVPSPKER